VRNLEVGIAKEWAMHFEYMKSKIRCKAEHPFHIIEGIFSYRKVVYRGIAKNLNRLYMLFGSANLFMWAWAGCPIKPLVD